MGRLVLGNYFADPVSGRPIASAKIFIGEPDKDPELFPIDVYGLQENGESILLPQPIRTGAGGTPIFDGASIVVSVELSIYSIKVKDAKDSQKFYIPAIDSSEPLVVEGVSDLTELVGGTCIVRDANRGGTFVYDPEKKLENDGGTVFNGWVRQYFGGVNIKWFGSVSGVENDESIQNAILTGEPITVDSGFDLCFSGSVNNWEQATNFIIYGTVNGDANATSIKGGNVLIYNADRKRTVIRSVDFVSDGYVDDKAAKAGSSLRIDAVQEAGGSSFYLNTGDRKAVIATTDYVQMHTVLYNSLVAPRSWGFNSVTAKNVNSSDAGTDTSCFGSEISMTNNTTETGLPLASNQVTGLFLSYINTSNTASSAIAIGGLSNGWEHGVYIDGITTDGIAIKVADDVAPNQGMKSGLDVTQVQSFSEGAIRLGNNHSIVGKVTGGGDRTIANYTVSNELQLGDSTAPTSMRAYASDIKINGVSLGSSNTVPSNFDAALFVNINGTQYKIMLLKV